MRLSKFNGMVLFTLKRAQKLIEQKIQKAIINKNKLYYK